MKTARVYENKGISQFELSKKILNNLSQFKISPSAKLVLLYLADCYNPKNSKMFPKQKTIAAKLGISERSVIRAISELREGGLILIESNLSNRYVFGAKIGLFDTVEQKNFSSAKLSSQNDNLSSQNDKMSSSYIEQKKELNKKTNIDDYKILKEYAISKGAKNIPAYINSLVRSGASKQIIKELKISINNRKYMEKAIIENSQNLEYAKKHRISEEAFNEFSQKMRKIFENQGLKKAIK